MTKERYYEMCEALGSVPKEDEEPVDYDDFPIEIQEAINIYSMLSDNWDFVNGRYLGKNFVGLTEIFELVNVTDNETRRFIYDILRKIDSIRRESIKKLNASQNKKPPK